MLESWRWFYYCCFLSPGLTLSGPERPELAQTQAWGRQQRASALFTVKGTVDNTNQRQALAASAQSLLWSLRRILSKAAFPVLRKLLGGHGIKKKKKVSKKRSIQWHQMAGASILQMISSSVVLETFGVWLGCYENGPQQSSEALCPCSLYCGCHCLTKCPLWISCDM